MKRISTGVITCWLVSSDVRLACTQLDRHARSLIRALYLSLSRSRTG